MDRAGRASFWQELFELSRVRVVLFLREPEAVFWVVFFPIILAFVLSLAFRKGDLEPSRVAVLGTPSADIIEQLKSFGGENDTASIEILEDLNETEARARLRRGALDAILLEGESKELVFDPDRAEGVLGRDRILNALGEAPSSTQSEFTQTPIERGGTRYIDFLFPGLLGMNLMGTGIWAIAFAIADMRQKKLLKRFLVTPMRRSSFLLSFASSRLVFLILEVAVLMAFGLFILKIPFVGSLLAFTMLTVISSLMFASMGLLAASRTQSIEGVSGIINLIMMPMWLCSGIFFTYERFPDFLHPIIRLIPLTAVNDGLRSIMLDGAGISQILPQLLIVSVWGFLTFFLSLKMFRWT